MITESASSVCTHRVEQPWCCTDYRKGGGGGGGEGYRVPLGLHLRYISRFSIAIVHYIVYAESAFVIIINKHTCFLLLILLILSLILSVYIDFNNKQKIILLTIFYFIKNK